MKIGKLRASLLLNPVQAREAFLKVAVKCAGRTVDLARAYRLSIRTMLYIIRDFGLRPDVERIRRESKTRYRIPSHLLHY